MKVRSSQAISFIITTIIFAVALSYLFEGPKQLLNFSFIKDLPSLSTISDFFKNKEDNSKSKKKSPPSMKGTKGNASIGQVIDHYNGIEIYNNGSIGNITGRNITKDGYNLGLRYQCVEFVKRYYYEVHHHKMPDSYGNAKDFYNHALGDGQYNMARGLLQYSNPSASKPQVDDILIFGPTSFNQFGHIAIVSEVGSNHIQIAQQNAGGINSTRQNFELKYISGYYKLDAPDILGWLRKK